jgi:hypothetical protein
MESEGKRTFLRFESSILRLPTVAVVLVRGMVRTASLCRTELYYCAATFVNFRRLGRECTRNLFERGEKEEGIATKKGIGLHRRTHRCGFESHGLAGTLFTVAYVARITPPSRAAPVDQDRGESGAVPKLTPKRRHQTVTALYLLRSVSVGTS